MDRASLVVQWLGLHASTAGGTGSIPGWGTKILHAEQSGQKKKKWNGNFHGLISVVNLRATVCNRDAGCLTCSSVWILNGILHPAQPEKPWNSCSGISSDFVFNQLNQIDPQP